MTKLSKNTCDGCSDYLKLHSGYAVDSWHDYAATIEIAPNVIVNVCAVSRNNFEYHDHDTRYTPKIACLRKAFEAKNVCQGCGEPRDHRGAFGGLCSNCRNLLDRARVRAVALEGEKPHVYALGIDLITSNYPDNSSWDYGEGTTPDDFADKLLDCVSRVAAAKGPRRPSSELDYHGISLPASYQDDSGRGRAELDTDQRKAVEDLGANIKMFANAMFLQGRKAGRDLLGGLATGKVSISDFADKHESWDKEESE